MSKDYSPSKRHEAYLRQKEKALEYGKEYYQKHKEKRKQYQRDSYNLLKKDVRYRLRRNEQNRKYRERKLRNEQANKNADTDSPGKSDADLLLGSP